VVAVGSSTGGPQALGRLLNGLRRAPARPILITQHMPPAFIAMLATQLSRAIGRPCTEPGDGEPVRDDGVYLAPGDFHMLTEPGGDGGPVLRLSRAEPENYCRPAVDPMLRSVAQTYGERSVAVVLTGIGRDGADGCAAIRTAGGRVVVQDEASSVVWGMPGAVVRRGLADAVLPVDEIARLLCAASAK
jgi:two-component system chemotaxis response regulator CheB